MVQLHFFPSFSGQQIKPRCMTIYHRITTAWKILPSGKKIPPSDSTPLKEGKNLAGSGKNGYFCTIP